MTYLASLAEIYIYPIKSLPGIKLDKALITKYGLAHPENQKIIDRKWLIIDQEGTFKTQRQYPRMALIKPSFQDDYLILNAPGLSEIKISLDPVTDKKVKCRVWQSYINGYSYGGEVANWLNQFLEADNLDLVIFNDDLEPRKVKELREQSDDSRDIDVVIYEDYSPFMLISENSLNELNKKLEKKVTMRNFRPNFVAKDCQAFAEDDWSKFQIGNSKFTKIKHCTRCLFTTVDPETGIKDIHQQPLKTLKDFRTNKELYGTSPMFGINIAPDSIGLLVHVGDKITLKED